MQLQAKQRLLAGEPERVKFSDFEKWKAKAKSLGCNVRKVSSNKTAAYYQAIYQGHICGSYSLPVSGSGGGGSILADPAASKKSHEESAKKAAEELYKRRPDLRPPTIH